MGQAPVPVDKQFSEDQKRKVRELFELKKTQEEIANEFGVSRHTIMRLCAYLGLHRNHTQAQKSRFDSSFVEQVVKLRNEGKVITEIASLTGRSISAISRVCIKKNISKPSVDYNNIGVEYESGSTLADLADKYHTSVYTISRELEKLGVKKRQPLLIFSGVSQKRETNLLPFQDTVEWFTDAYIDRRHSLTQIANFLGKSIGYVTGKLSKYNIKTRSISEGVRRLDPNIMIASYKELGSMSKVAKKFGCTVMAINNILEANNITPTPTSEMFTGSGNSFFGKKHPEEIRKKCAQIGAIGGAKFWVDHPEYVEVVREKQKLIWSDLEKRRLVSEFVSRLRAEGKLKSKKGVLNTRFGSISFDSSWEAGLVEILEKDDRVVWVEREFDLIEYEFGSIRHFVPDFRIWLQNGEFIVVEIKNNWLLLQPKEQAKVSAAFGSFMDKFMVVDNNYKEVLDRITLLMSPVDFSFNDLEIKEVISQDYSRFYGLFHYMGKTGRQGFTLGAFLSGKLIAVSTISSITRNEIAERIGKNPSEVRELVRFCIHPDFHKKNFGSWFLSRVSSEYTSKNPAISTLISFADTTQGHTGSIYKAAGWLEDGVTGCSYHYVDRQGNIIHKKTIYDRAKAEGTSESVFAIRCSLQKILELPKIRFRLNIG